MVFSTGAVIALLVVRVECSEPTSPELRVDVLQVNDKVGRKHSITIGSDMVGAVLQTASVNVAIFLVVRLFLTGSA